MITALRPGYTPPSPYQISGKLLDAACTKVNEELITQLQNCSLTLILDNWSNVKNDPILATSLHTGMNCFLYDTLEFGSMKKTAAILCRACYKDDK